MRRLFTLTSRVARLALVLLVLAPVQAATDLDPKAITIQIPTEIKWVERQRVGERGARRRSRTSLAFTWCCRSGCRTTTAGRTFTPTTDSSR